MSDNGRDDAAGGVNMVDIARIKLLGSRLKALAARAPIKGESSSAVA